MGIRTHMHGLALIICLSLVPVATFAEDANHIPSPDTKVYLDLTHQYYEALRQADNGKTRSLGTDRSDIYLQQIAISTRFLVETHLKLLKEQAEIKALLKELLNPPKQP